MACPICICVGTNVVIRLCSVLIVTSSNHALSAFHANRLGMRQDWFAGHLLRANLVGVFGQGVAVSSARSATRKSALIPGNTTFLGKKIVPQKNRCRAGIGENHGLISKFEEYKRH